MADTQKQKDDFENLAMLSGAKDQTKNIVVASAAEKTASAAEKTASAAEKTASAAEKTEQQSIVQQQTELVSDMTKKGEVLYNNLSTKGKASVAGEYEIFKSAGARCVEDPSLENIRKYNKAFFALVQAVQKSTDITDKQRKEFRELYHNFQREIIPFLLNDNRIGNARDVYFDEEMVRKWYEQYYRSKMEEIITSSKNMTDDLVNRLTYTKEAAVEASLALTGELAGNRLIFTDSGSASELGPVPPEMVRMVRKATTAPYMVAGGIRTLDEARDIIRAGADMIQIGTVIEKADNIAEVVSAFHRTINDAKTQKA